MSAIRSALVVDDDPIQCELLSSVLKSRGIPEVLVVSSGPQLMRAVDAAGRGYDLVLCDLNMPEFDGVEFIMYMGRSKARSALVIISGASGEITKAADRLARALGLDYHGLLPKPVDLRALDAILAAIEQRA